MGYLRIMLAICVFWSHSVPLAKLPWLDGQIAVQIFFVISGFYMQLILATKYTKERLGNSWIQKFYLSRYMRLYPIYFLGVASSLIYPAALFLKDSVFRHPINEWIFIANLPQTLSNIFLKLYVGFTNLFIVFQDWSLFLTLDIQKNQIYLDPHGFAPSPDGQFYLQQSLAVGAAWTLAIEIAFYVLAPFILKLSTKKLAIYSIVFVILKIIVLWNLTTPSDGLKYRFFPFELPWFLVGAISFRHKEYLISLFSWVRKEHESILSYALVTFLCIASISFTTDPKLSLITRLLYPTIFAIIIPFIFHATARMQYDSFIGELSYPFYVFHQSTVLSITNNVFPKVYTRILEPDNGEVFYGIFHIYALMAVIFTFILALLAHHFEKEWVEPIRQKLSQPIRVRETVHHVSCVKKN
jgi:peptidoglycan/LPS O-acetylase OafA/YrhL